MSFEQHHWKYGNSFGIRYIFHTEGSGLPAHKHDIETAHNIIVLRGTICVSYPETPNRCDVVGQGYILNLDWSKLHAIKAIEEDTEILNLFLNGQPKGYEELPESEKHVVFK